MSGGRALGLQEKDERISWDRDELDGVLVFALQL